MAGDQSYQSDEHILCDDCDRLYKGDCTIHGPLEWIKNSRAVGSSQYSPSIASLPDGLLLKESTIPDVGMGVFAARIIHKRLMFGPFQGKQMLPEQLRPGQNLSYSWDLLQNGIATSVLDGFDDRHSNWMRFVAYSRDRREQNLIAFQYCGHIYYRTFRDIYPGEELMVWFEDEYCCSIDDLPEEFSGDQVPEFACLRCRLVFAGATYLYKHHKFRCPNGPLSSTYGARTTGLVGALFRLPVEVPGDSWPNVEVMPNNNNSPSSSSPETSSPESHHSRRKSKPRKLTRQADGDDLFNPPPASFLSQNDATEYDNRGLVMLPPQTHSYVPSPKHQLPWEADASDGLKRHAEAPEVSPPEKQPRITEEDAESPDEKHPYACGVCGKTFARPTWWAKHESSHSCKKNQSSFTSVLPAKPDTIATPEVVVERKPMMKNTRVSYKCDQCDKSFACPSWLKRHKKVHGIPSSMIVKSTPVKPPKAVSTVVDGSRPYVCRDCGRRFAVPAWLTRHRMSHHKDNFSKPHMCGVCGRSFAVAYWLIRHQKMYHNLAEDATTPTATVTTNGAAATEASGSAAATETSDGAVAMETSGSAVAMETSDGAAAAIAASSTAQESSDELLPWKCGECGLAFKYSSWLRRHQRNNGHNKPRADGADAGPNSDRPFLCDRRECGKTFATKRQYGRHRRRHIKNDIANGKIVPQEKPPTIQGPPFICPISNCNKSFSARHLYMRHKRRHTKSLTQVQTKTTEQPQELPTENKVEPAVETFKCTDCGEEFDEKSLLEEHSSKAHITEQQSDETEKENKAQDHPTDEDVEEEKLDGPPFNCKVCGKVFSYALLLRRHVARHKKNENTKKKLFKALNLKGSIIPEGEERSLCPYVCEVCNASFKGLHLWNRHMIKHLSDKDEVVVSEKGEKKTDTPIKKSMYGCDVCGKTFAAAFWLTRHKKEHAEAPEGEKQSAGKASTPAASATHTVPITQPAQELSKFTCDECGRSFAASFWLTRHKKEHLKASERAKEEGSLSQQKPQTQQPGRGRFKCDECGRSFAVAFWLTRHKREHIKELERQGIIPEGGSDPSSQRPVGVKKNGRTVFECPDCDREFPWPSWLVKHRRIHQRAPASAKTQLQETQKSDTALATADEPTVEHRKEDASAGIAREGDKSVDTSSGKVTEEETSKVGSKDLKNMKAEECYEVFGDVGVKQYRCTICKKTSAWHTGIVYHVRVHHTHERPFQCQVCKKAFHMAGDLTKHAKRHAGEKPFPCKGCSKCFATAQQARKHASTHHATLPYHCSNCGKRYRDRSSVWKHKLSGPCGKAISEKRKMLRVAAPAPATKPKVVPLSNQSSNQCPVCNKQFEDGGSLWGHRLRMHPNLLLGSCKRCGVKKEEGHSCQGSKKDARLSCYRCGESFSDRDAYRTHLTSHKSGEKIICEYCGKSWLRRADLTRHLRVHTGERPYPCPECGLAFKVSDGLKRHMRSLHPNSTKQYVRIETTPLAKLDDGDDKEMTDEDQSDEHEQSDEFEAELREEGLCEKDNTTADSEVDGTDVADDEVKSQNKESEEQVPNKTEEDESSGMKDEEVGNTKEPKSKDVEHQLDEDQDEPKEGDTVMKETLPEENNDEAIDAKGGTSTEKLQLKPDDVEMPPEHGTSSDVAEEDAEHEENEDIDMKSKPEESQESQDATDMLIQAEVKDNETPNEDKVVSKEEEVEIPVEAVKTITEELTPPVEEAKSPAEVGMTTAEEGKTTAEEGKTTAEVGKTTAEEGKTTVEVKTTVKEVKTTAEELTPPAEENKSPAEEVTAQTKKGKTTAEVKKLVKDVKTSAEELTPPSVEVKSSAEEVTRQVEEGKTKKEKVKTTVEGATTQAEELTSPAEEVKSPLEEGTTQVEEGKTPAEDGKTTAEEVKITAEVTTTSKDRKTAKRVKSPVEEVKSPVEEGKTPAEDGKTTAEEVKITAEVTTTSKDRKTAKRVKSPVEEVTTPAEEGKTPAEELREDAIADRQESDKKAGGKKKKVLKKDKANDSKEKVEPKKQKGAHKGHSNKRLAGRKCDYCGKVFSLPGNLARHVRLHTGEKPFACKTCGETFMRSDVLGQHIATFHQ